MPILSNFVHFRWTLHVSVFWLSVHHGSTLYIHMLMLYNTGSRTLGSSMYLDRLLAMRAASEPST